MPYKVKFTVDEIKEMKEAVAQGHTSWDSHAGITDVKTKIKKFGLAKSDHRCCYCGRNLNGEYNMVIDVEHVLPKSHFIKHMFTVRNLSVACKRCNMHIKKNRLDFLSTPHTLLPKRVFRAKYYRFIHPHLDKYDKHLKLRVQQDGKLRLVKYEVVGKSAKGSFTYDYFKLSQLEMDNFDKAQGGRGRPEIENQVVKEMFERLQG